MYDVALFPTHVGVNRKARILRVVPRAFPHACGGEPVALGGANSEDDFSPRM